MRTLHWVVLTLLLCIKAHPQTTKVVLDGVEIAIQTIRLDEREAGQPVIVFESGLGTPMGNWDKIVADSLNLGPMVTYDRPGIGASEAIDEAPTLKNVADRLVSLLEHLKVEPPYVLVGHSLGGVYVRGFAVYYPEKLAGLVIVDPGDFTETQQNKRDYYEVLDWDEERISQHIRMEVDKRARRRAGAPPAIRREGEALARMRIHDFQEIQTHALPNIPVHIVVGGRFDLPPERRSKEFDEERLFRSKTKHRVARWTDVIQSVERGMLLYSGDAGHFVQWVDPELVIASIKIVLKDYGEMISATKDE